MHRRRRQLTGQLTVSVLLIGALGGCANLFTGNLFENFDGPPSASEVLGGYTDAAGDVTTDDADGFVNALDEALDSPKFFDDLSSTDRDNLAGSLESVYTNGAVDDTTRQEAAIMAGDVILTGTNSGATINNVADVLTSSGGTDSFSDPATLLDQIIPDSAQGDAAAIQGILDDMVSAAGAYEALGGSLTDVDGDGSVDGPDGANMTEVAQKAAVAIAVKSIVEDGGSGGSEGLAQAIADGTVEDLSISGDPIADAGTEGSAFNKILQAGGLDGLFNQ